MKGNNASNPVAVLLAVAVIGIIFVLFGAAAFNDLGHSNKAVENGFTTEEERAHYKYMRENW